MPPLTYDSPSAKLDLQAIADAEASKRQSKGDGDIISKFDCWYNESQELRRNADSRWAKNIKLIRGIWPDDELSRSKVRKRSKIFFRKIWASNWRLLAAVNDAFLHETDQFRVVGRNGEDGDEEKAELLQLMAEYRRDLLMRTESFYLQQIWSIMSILDLGWAVAKFGWCYDKKRGIDKPDFVLYPNEQVYADFSATLPHRMRYIMFENFLSKEELADMGYTTEGLQLVGSTQNIVRSARFQGGQRDPMNYADTNTNQTYPKPGSEGVIDKTPISSKYVLREVFYKEDGQIKFSAYSGSTIKVKPMDSPYGKRYPVVMGQCLTLAHQMIGEGFPEAQEGPQTSLNVTLNQRKDNVSVLMNGESIVDRYANVDLEALRTSRASNIILSDSPDAVRQLEKREVTQTAYMEAAGDAAMMDEVSGVTPGLVGLDKSQKATTSQLNFQNAGAKVGLYISIIAKTWFQDLFTQLTYMIQRFETDETVFRVANRSLNKKLQEKGKAPLAKPIEDIDDFIADIDVQVNPDMSTKEQRARNVMLAMDRAIMSNQALIPLVQSGVVPPEGVELMNPAEFMRVLLPDIGQKNVQKFFLKIQKKDLPPPVPPGAKGGTGGGKAAQMLAGANAAQAETPDIIPSTQAQDIQGGSSGT